jgi:hypothetical protein
MQLLMMKEYNFYYFDEFLAFLEKTRRRRELSHQNLLKFYDYSSIVKEVKDSEVFQIRKFYQVCQSNLVKDVMALKARRQRYSSE